MHIHGNSMNINAASLYSAAQAEHAAAAQRAAETRKKLLKFTASLNSNDASSYDPATPVVSLLISQWLDGQQNLNPHANPSQNQYPSAASGRDPDFS